ncbi:MAG: UvrB/UvrC motif-containing protein [Elusimicrobia bacterium]|nr:UvrB/UvrC motif-containing protein [Elusimicrobiota bacterium]
MIRRVHGSSQHQGKQYASPSTGANSKTKAAEMERLKKELALAIKKEDFEKAADLRDQIRRLES